MHLPNSIDKVTQYFDIYDIYFAKNYTFCLIHGQIIMHIIKRICNFVALLNK